MLILMLMYSIYKRAYLVTKSYDGCALRVVFSKLQNCADFSDGDFRDGGSAFQHVGPETAKAREPHVTVLVRVKSRKSSGTDRCVFYRYHTDVTRTIPLFMKWLLLSTGCCVSESVVLQSGVSVQCHYVDIVCEISAEMLVDHCHCYKHRFKLLLHCQWCR